MCFILNLFKTVHSTNSELIQDILCLTEEPHSDKNILYTESCYQNFAQYQLSTDSEHFASYRKTSYWYVNILYYILSKLYTVPTKF